MRDELLWAEDARFHIRKRTLPTSPRDLERIVARWPGAFAGF
jgi:hypothetical protein